MWSYNYVTGFYWPWSNFDSFNTILTGFWISNRWFKMSLLASTTTTTLSFKTRIWSSYGQFYFLTNYISVGTVKNSGSVQQMICILNLRKQFTKTICVVLLNMVNFRFSKHKVYWNQYECVCTNFKNGILFKIRFASEA